MTRLPCTAERMVWQLCVTDMYEFLSRSILRLRRGNLSEKLLNVVIYFQKFLKQQKLAQLSVRKICILFSRCCGESFAVQFACVWCFTYCGITIDSFLKRC